MTYKANENKTADNDKRAEKREELHRTFKAVGDGIFSPVNGFCEVEWQCECGTINRATKSPAYRKKVHCRFCEETTMHMRYRG